MPPQLQPLIAAVNKDGDGKFDVKQKLTSPWNMLIGAQFKSVLHDTKTARIILADGYTPLSQKRYSPATKKRH
jgi:hypothetical protein